MLGWRSSRMSILRMSGLSCKKRSTRSTNNSQFQWVQVQVTSVSTINQCSPPANNACNELIQGQTQTMTISRTYAPARGIYAISNNGTSSVPDDATLLNSGTASPMPQLALIASQVNF